LDCFLDTQSYCVAVNKTKKTKRVKLMSLKPNKKHTDFVFQDLLFAPGALTKEEREHLAMETALKKLLRIESR
jgi:hypothetical protein